MAAVKAPFVVVYLLFNSTMSSCAQFRMIYEVPGRFGRVLWVVGLRGGSNPEYTSVQGALILCWPEEGFSLPRPDFCWHHCTDQLFLGILHAFKTRKMSSMLESRDKTQFAIYLASLSIKS